MQYWRKLLPELEKQIDKKEIVVVTGMRRVGKTTLLRMLYDKTPSQNKVFLDIENPLDQKIFEEVDFNNIWQNLKPFGITQKEKPYLFLDEIQAKPEIVKTIKYLFDHYEVKFFVTGSSSFYLKNLFPESLSGRKAIYELCPLDFEEYLIFKNQPKKFTLDFSMKDKNKNPIEYEKYKKLYEEYMEWGGFPQVVLAEDEREKSNFIKDIFKSYFEKDVKLLADFREINIFRDLLLLLIQRVGAKIDISKLASEIGVSRDTIYSYLSFLQGTYFVYLIPPYTNDPDREVSGAKKVYICDNGFLTQIGRVSWGNLLENAVFHNIKKYGRVCYYQRRSGTEVDFIIPERSIALEVKTTGTKQDRKKLRRYIDLLRLKEGYVISRSYVDKDGFIPAQDI